MTIQLIDLKAQYISIKDEINSAINRVLDSACFISGEEVSLFEKEFAGFCRARHCAGVSSGTAALHLALLGCEIGPGNEVITSPNTFIATCEAISHTGAKIVFVDIEPNTYTIDVEKLEQAITKQTKAIIPVHLYGHPANMPHILEIAKQYNLKVIEDAAQAHGAKVNGQMVGTFGDVGCFSFFPAKNLGSYGDAGGIITNNNEIAEHVFLLRNHGRASKFIHKIEGFNCRLDSLQASILRVKLKYLSKWTEIRRKLAANYSDFLKDLPVVLPYEALDCYHVYHLYVIRTCQRDKLRTSLKEQGIETGIHYPVPLHLQPAYKYLGYNRGDFPVTEKCADEIISLPLYPELSKVNQEKVMREIKNILVEKEKTVLAGGIVN